MAPSNPTRGLRRSVSSTLDGVTRLFSRHRTSHRGDRDQAASPFVADDESSRPQASQASQGQQFDKRCVVTFESGRGTIRVVRQSFAAPEPRTPPTPPTSSEGLSSGFLSQELPHEVIEPCGTAEHFHPSLLLSEEEHELSEFPQFLQNPRQLLTADDANDLKQRVLEMSKKLDIMHKTMCEGLRAMDAKLNRMHALLESAAIKAAAQENLHERIYGRREHMHDRERM
ncbi:hypothetical protein F5Y06DRAFT_259617 [Hypoxylon sp. FL0890]|nr:hypothetical protein F5Y06DRAFT_259617 [Hypoxylon sp. FL0890]